MKDLITFLFIATTCITGIPVHAQVEKNPVSADSLALEAIIVEKYYVADATGMEDKVLPPGAITYRVYVDMQPGYSLQAVFGIPGHEFRLQTTTFFYNTKNIAGGKKSGDWIDDAQINEGTVALDSWITMGAATKSHFGIPRNEDNDGSILERKGLADTDGLLAGKVPSMVFFGLDLISLYYDDSISVFSGNNGSWAVFGGVKGPTESNRVLVAQMTTHGEFSFELNIQIGTPLGGTVQFVAKDPVGDEIQFEGLTFPGSKALE